MTLLEAAKEYLKGSVCQKCVEDYGSDYPHPNDKAREALRAAIEQEEIEKAGWRGLQSPDAVALDNVATELRMARRQRAILPLELEGLG